MNDFSYEILDLMKKYHGDEQAALAGESSPKCLYAFSPLRENLLEWVEFPERARILQMGSDYGSFTGLLSRKAGEVIVIDDRDENLEVNRSRHENCKNIRYGRDMAGDGRMFGKYKEYRKRNRSQKKGGETAAEGGDLDEAMERPFDAVILVGYLEFHRKEEAAEIFRRAAGFLKPGGRLIAAAENSFGVRYLMGAAAYPVSFLEAEFRELFEELEKELGGRFMMYYPVPDYRYPTAVFSDFYLPETGDVTNISARLDGPGFYFGSEEEAMAKACKNGTFAKLTNSFLGIWEKGNV